MNLSKETEFGGLVCNGFVMMFLILVMFGLSAYLFVLTASDVIFLPWAISLVILAIIFLFGFIMLEPNEAKVLVFFGKYEGTFSKTGFYWINPFMGVRSISLRVRNLNPEPIKVNDKSGNPIRIGMVVVWKVEDTYKVLFDIDSNGALIGELISFVSVQSDAALRQVAGCYSYDNASSEEELTLRSNADEINEQLVKTLNDRLNMAGLRVIEARINYLAYAPEIAAVMLRRQQADAIIAAREKIVEGAVSMVKIALDKLKDEGVVDLDEERKAAMVSNLLVVLCGNHDAQPVVNSGSLY